ncbi:hypothetical protein HanIR_Chr08g0388231 [Helianthus annuus]|nr:hypothetical protein HanIR_Chr08g0388231 [Helianthus annuus]
MLVNHRSFLHQWIPFIAATFCVGRLKYLRRERCGNVCGNTYGGQMKTREKMGNL